MEPDTFLSQVERAITASGLTPTAFGKAAAGDPKFVFDLRGGRECRRRVRDRVLGFIATLPKRRRVSAPRPSMR